MDIYIDRDIPEGRVGGRVVSSVQPYHVLGYDYVYTITPVTRERRVSLYQFIIRVYITLQ